jgi:hypothetical protein
MKAERQSDRCSKAVLMGDEAPAMGEPIGRDRHNHAGV